MDRKDHPRLALHALEKSIRVGCLGRIFCMDSCDVKQSDVPTLEHQIQELTNLLEHLKRHERRLRVELRGNEAAQRREQSKRQTGLDLTEAMKVKLRSMEAVITTICDQDSHREEAKYVSMFIKLLDSWEDEDESLEHEATKEEQANSAERENLNRSLIDGLSTKLKQIGGSVPLASFPSSCSEDEVEDVQESQPEKEETESQADLLARVLQRLEGHEARRRADLQRLEQARLEISYPGMIRPGSSSASCTLACC